MEMVLFMTELVNLTDKTIGFQAIVGEYRRPLNDVPPNTKGCVAHSSIWDHQYRVVSDGYFTGKKLYAYYISKCVRIVFTYDSDNKLLMQGAFADNNFDKYLRMRGIGLLLGRDKRWNTKPLVNITHIEELKKPEPKPKPNPEADLSSKEEKDENRQIQVHIHTHIHTHINMHFYVPPPQ
ncbi:hypothetical protein ACP275_01G031600 [Erythranthe tilingii]